MNCGLCASEKLRPEDEHGMRQCARCGAHNVIRHTGATPLPDQRELAAELLTERQENEAQLRDMRAAEGIGLHRGFGG